MSASYAANIRPFIERELSAARDARIRADSSQEFRHLENAHVLGQESTYWHTKVHCLMLAWAMRNRSIPELFGQLLRIVGAATKTAIGLVPAGNTGGTNVSPFKPMPIDPEFAKIIQAARAGV